MRSLLITFALVLSAESSTACSIEESPSWRDEPIQVAPDGSFEKAEGFAFDRFFGGKIVGLGDARVAQRITYAGACGDVRETLLFADCDRAEVVEVLGQEDPSQPEGWRDDLIDLIQVPVGAIDVRQVSSVAELVSIAYKNDYRVNLNVERHVASMKRRNRYDPFNGCKLYYPDSPGAKL